MKTTTQPGSGVPGTLNRRDLLRAAGFAGAAAACDPKVPVEHLLPYVVQPEQIVPGVATWFATRCDECAAGCGLLARVREGRVVKLEGNPDHPTNRGKVCTRGLAGIQATYNPDRFTGPLRGRDSRHGTPLSWEDAIAEIGAAVAAAHGRVAWLGRPRGGSFGALVQQFAGAAGARVATWDPLGRESLRAASRAVFGRDAIPSWHLENARTIVSFGADFLSTWGDVMGQTRGWADSRDPAKGAFVSRLVCVEPRVGVTSASADLHLAAVPGTEAGVALALAALVAARNGYAGPALALVENVDVDAAADRAGLARARLEEVAGWLAEGPSAVLPGGTATSAASTDLAVAAYVLAEVAGNLGDSIRFGPDFAEDGAGSFADVQALLADCRAGDVGVLFVDDLDPVFALPPAAGAKEALEAVDLLVSFANEPNDSLTEGGIVLPPGSTLERWGDAEDIRGRHTLQQPAMRPLHDTRAAGEAILAISRAAGFGATLPRLDAPDWPTWVRARWEVLHREKTDGSVRFEDFWVAALQRGGWFEEAPVSTPVFALERGPSLRPATPEGDGLVLALFPHPFVLDGRHANKPWAQEIPDPISSFVWGTWAEVHPETARELDLDPDRAVVVETDQGALEMGWFASPGIRRDTVAVVMGNGHERGGRYTRWGANPMRLLPASPDRASGALPYVATRARLRWSRAPSPVFRQLHTLTMEGRNLSFVSSVEDLAHFTGPGEAIATHHFPMDQRLEDAGVLEMYPQPSHPTYRFAMALDLNRCNGCGACEAACYAENNIPIVGPDECRKRRRMGWIRIDRFWEGEGEEPDVRFHPVMCQQCGLAPCEGVCPVLATYHNLDGLNAMVYNRCVGTRYCANNCPYTARRFNYHHYKWPEAFNLMLNPDVSTREVGVMEKCTFCVQRIREAKDTWRDRGETVPDGALRKLPACAQACPGDAITFGNLKDEGAEVSRLFTDRRAAGLLDEVNAKPAVRYLSRIRHIESQVHGLHARRSAQAPQHHDFVPDEDEGGRTEP